MTNILYKHTQGHLVNQALKPIIEQGTKQDTRIPLLSGGIYKFYKYPYRGANGTTKYVMYEIEFCIWIAPVYTEPIVFWENSIMMN